MAAATVVHDNVQIQCTDQLPFTTRVTLQPDLRAIVIDAPLIKHHLGEMACVDLAAPQWDYDRSGGVTGGDYALIKPRLGSTAESCAK